MKGSKIILKELLAIIKKISDCTKLRTNFFKKVIFNMQYLVSKIFSLRLYRFKNFIH